MSPFERITAIPDGGWAKTENGWYVRPPGTRRAASIQGHDVVEHDDGTITVTPSLRYSSWNRNDYWHGWLTAGQWSVA